jgi:coenzyme PQQ synthesis protein D (PqqD)
MTSRERFNTRALRIIRAFSRDPLPDFDAHLVFRRSPAVEETHVRDRVVLYQKESGNAIVLNPTATILWEQLRSDADLNRLIQELSSRFADIDREQIAEDVRVCLGELTTERLIQQVS